MPAVGGWLWGGRVTHVPPHQVPCVTLELRAHCHPRGTVGLLGTHQPLGPLSWWGHSSHPAVPKTPRPAVPCHQTVSLSGDPPPCLFLPLSPHHIPPSPQLGWLSPGPIRLSPGVRFPRSAAFGAAVPGGFAGPRALAPVIAPRPARNAPSRLFGKFPIAGAAFWGSSLGGLGHEPLCSSPRRPPRPGQGTRFT